jgi:hypothetical protein
MDVYPSYYTAHNVPLLVLSGLGPDDSQQAGSDGSKFPAFEENGIRLSTASPTIETPDATQLLRHFLAADATRTNQDGGKTSYKAADLSFKIKVVGRVGL